VVSETIVHQLGKEARMQMAMDTPNQLLQSIVDGINTGNLDGLMTL
jgi:hypothetical protein